MDRALNLLVAADKKLDQIAVKANDVFILAEARTMLKAAYDSIVKEVNAHANESLSHLDGPGSAGD